MLDENELMQQVQSGKLEKLAVLFEQNHVALFNYFLRSGNTHAVSEDLVQETFMKILAYRSSFNGTSSFKSWMYGIGRNTCADYYRKLKNANQHVDIDDVEVSFEQTLDDQFQQTQQHELFVQSLATLTSEQREIIMLSRFQQLNYQEIADMLDCNLNTLKARMSKALDMLKRAYDQLSSRGNV